MKSVASVRWARIHFGTTLVVDEERGSEQKALDIHLEDDSQVLALSLTSSFYVALCESCQRECLDKVERTNNRGSYFTVGGERLDALACYFDRRIRFRAYACRWCDGFG